MARKQLEAFVQHTANKREKRQRESQTPVLDLRATHLAKGVVPAVTTVPDVGIDPSTGVRWNLKVIRNIRHDPIGAMEARKQLQPYQIAAARHWQELHEASQIGGIKAMDTTKEPVDGSPERADPINDRQRKALAELHRADLHLGVQGAVIVRLVLADCLSIGQVAERYGDNSKITKDRFGWMFRMCLDELAKCYGKADKRLATVEALG